MITTQKGLRLVNKQLTLVTVLLVVGLLVGSLSTYVLTKPLEEEVYKINWQLTGLILILSILIILQLTVLGVVFYG